MTKLTNEQIESILEGVKIPHHKTYDTRLRAYSGHVNCHNLSDLREILSLRQEVERLRDPWIIVDNKKTIDLHGLFWVYGCYPETDGDVDDYGKNIGWYTGEMEDFTALVEIDFSGEVWCISENECCPVNSMLFDDFCNDHQITHYKPFSIPEKPKEK